MSHHREAGGGGIGLMASWLVSMWVCSHAMQGACSRKHPRRRAQTAHFPPMRERFAGRSGFAARLARSPRGQMLIRAPSPPLQRPAAGISRAPHRRMSAHATGQIGADGVKHSMECWQAVGIESALTFSLRHLVMSEIRGRFRRWGAMLVLDREDHSRALLKAWIDLASIDTGSVERDQHIRSAEFFDVGRFPFAEFRSEAIAPLDEHRYLARGPLVLHGKSRPVELIVAPGPKREDAGVA